MVPGWSGKYLLVTVLTKSLAGGIGGAGGGLQPTVLERDWLEDACAIPEAADANATAVAMTATIVRLDIRPSLGSTTPADHDAERR